MSGKYNEGREAMADGELSWGQADVVAQLVSAGYVFSAEHRGAKEVATVGEPMAVPGRTVEAGGWLRCSRLVFRQVSGERVGAVVFRTSGDGGRLIFYCNEVANFPMKPNGGDIEIDVPERGLFRV